MYIPVPQARQLLVQVHFPAAQGQLQALQVWVQAQQGLLHFPLYFPQQQLVLGIPQGWQPGNMEMLINLLKLLVKLQSMKRKWIHKDRIIIKYFANKESA